MAEDSETVRELRQRVAELEAQRPTVRPDRVAFMAWLLKSKNLDTQDFDGLTDNAKGVLHAEFADGQAVEARKVEVQTTRRSAVLPPEGASWSPSRQLHYANLVEMNADDEAFCRASLPIPQRD